LRPSAIDGLLAPADNFLPQNEFAGFEMKESLATFFIFGALVVLFGHTAIPHCHENSVDQIQIITKVETQSLSDIILAALSIDLGNDHLEHYTISNQGKCKQEKSGLNPLSCSIDLTKSSLPSPSVANCGKTAKLAIPHFQFPCGMRAPPCIQTSLPFFAAT
jgi:hypothetical protein